MRQERSVRATGNADANLSIKVSATDPGGLSDNTTFTLPLKLPTGGAVVHANADTASATEAGGLNNATAGTDPTGNVLTGAGADSGTDIAVTQVQAGATLTSGAASVDSGSSRTSKSNHGVRQLRHPHHGRRWHVQIHGG